jgi:Xaa-Pro aminopeptidase
LLNEARAEKKMIENDFDALIATSNANVFYTCDVYPFDQSFTLLPVDRDLEPALVTSIYGTTPVVLMSPPWFSDVRYYGEFYVETSFAEEPLLEDECAQIRAHTSWDKSRESDPIKILVEILQERGIIKGRIGIDDSQLHLNDKSWMTIRSSLPDIELVSARDMFIDIRMIKSEEEINRIQQATSITSKALETSFERVHHGMTEKEFAETFQHAVISEGGSIVPFKEVYGTPVSFGRRSAYCDLSQPSDYMLQEGDIIRYDGGCYFKGYGCDMARTAVFGEPSDKLKKFWKAIFEGEQVAINMVEPGVEASAIFSAAMDRVRSSGIRHFRRHNVGHGWGLEGYDPPIIRRGNSMRLEEGMILCLETPYYEVGWGGIQHEDTVVVAEDGCRYLTKREEELRIIN